MSRSKVILAVQTDDGKMQCFAGYAYDIEIEVKADRVDYWGGGDAWMYSVPGPRRTRTTIEWAGDVITGFEGFNFDDVPGERRGIETGPGELR